MREHKQNTIQCTVPYSKSWKKGAEFWIANGAGSIKYFKLFKFLIEICLNLVY